MLLVAGAGDHGGVNHDGKPQPSPAPLAGNINQNRQHRQASVTDRQHRHDDHSLRADR
jgi:hypothetical protein